MFCRQCGTEVPAGAAFCSKCGASTGPVPGGPSPFASAPRRFAAYVIDYFVVVFAVGVPMAIAIIAARGMGILLFLPLLVVVPWLYHALMVSSHHQGTLGKIALGIKVTDERGARISFGHATGRLFAMMLSGMTMGIGYLMYFMTERCQTLHDKVAGTLVLVREATPDQVAGAAPAPRNSGWAAAVAIVAGCFGAIFIFGMLAAIAIPAYQDYTIRAQVTEGFGLAAPAQAAVEAALPAASGWPQLTTESLHLPPISGRYVARVQVLSGAVVITYGGLSNSALLGKDLVLVPAVDATRHVTWICASGPIPADATPAFRNPGQYTSVPLKWLPMKCRAG